VAADDAAALASLASAVDTVDAGMPVAAEDAVVAEDRAVDAAIAVAAARAVAAGRLVVFLTPPLAGRWRGPLTRAGAEDGGIEPTS
jgi:hypothetical protein